MVTRENIEVAGLQLKNHGAGNPRFLPGCRPHLFGKTAYHGLGFPQQRIMLKRVFGRDGFCGPVGHYFALIDAAGQFVETDSVSAKVPFECR